MVSGESALLLLVGFCVGTFGTLIGAGGGFILVPVLLLLYPNSEPENLTALSLAVVFWNALSGSIAYAKKKRIDYHSVFIFSLAAAPGSILGAYMTSLIPRKLFQLGFGIVLVLISIYIFFGKIKTDVTKNSSHKGRVLTDSSGQQYLIAYNKKLGIFISTIIGFISSFLGIGGGIIHVPAMVRVLNFPVHIATATSHAILAIVAFLGTMEHLFAGHLDTQASKLIWLVPSVILGAQLGAHLSHKVKDSWIIKSLAAGLFFMGLRFLNWTT